MSNKSRLEANNASLQTILGKVNALPDAGGGGSGASGEQTGLVEVTMGDMHEPGSYWLTMDLDGINLNDKLVVIIHRAGSLDVPILTLTRTSTSESFEATNHPSNGYISTNVSTITIMDNSITVMGSATIVNFNYEYTAYTSYDAGGSGGASVETCTVTITTAMGHILLRSVLATQYQNEQIIGYQEKSLYTQTVTILNVVKGSIISFETNSCIMPAYSATTGVSQNGYPYSSAAGNWSFTIAPTVSDNIEISVWDDD